MNRSRLRTLFGVVVVCLMLRGASISASTATSEHVLTTSDIHELQNDAHALLSLEEEVTDERRDQALRIASDLGAAGWRALDRDDPSAARELFGLSVELRERWSPGSEELVESLLGLGRSELQPDRDTSMARKAFHRALAISEGIDAEGLLTARCLSAAARVEEVDGNLELESEQLERALSIHSRVEPRSQAVFDLLRRLTTSEFFGQDYGASKTHAIQALDLLDEPTIQSDYLSLMLKAAGLSGYHEGDLETAEVYLQRDVELWETRRDDPVELARSLINRSAVPLELQQFREARDYLQRAVILLEEHAPEHRALAAAVGNLGEIAHRMGDLNAAEAYARRALALMEARDPGGLDSTNALRQLGIIANYRAHYDKATEYYERALAICVENEADYSAAETLHFMSENFVDMGISTALRRMT